MYKNYIAKIHCFDLNTVLKVKNKMVVWVQNSKHIN